MNLLPPTRQKGYQEEFLDIDPSVDNCAHERTIVGDFFEEVTEALTGAERLHTSSGRICPDLMIKGGFLECKALGSRRQPIVFKETMDNYVHLRGSGSNVVFVFWLHSYSFTSPTTKRAVRDGLAAAIDGVLLVPFLDLLTLCAPLKLHQLEYSNDRRKEAYRPAFGLFARKYMDYQQEVLCAGGKLRDGTAISAFPIHGVNPGIFHV